jgi:hypothetical protein
MDSKEKEEDLEEDEDSEEKEDEEKEDLDLTIEKPKRIKKIKKEVIDDSAFLKFVEENIKKDKKEERPVKNLEQAATIFPGFEKRSDPMSEISEEKDPLSYISSTSSENKKYITPGRDIEVAPTSTFTNEEEFRRRIVSSRENNLSIIQGPSYPKGSFDSVEKYVRPEFSNPEDLRKEISEDKKTKVRYTPSGY